MGWFVIQQTPEMPPPGSFLGFPSLRFLFPQIATSSHLCVFVPYSATCPGMDSNLGLSSFLHTHMASVLVKLTIRLEGFGRKLTHSNTNNLKCNGILLLSPLTRSPASPPCGLASLFAPPLDPKFIFIPSTSRSFISYSFMPSRFQQQLKLLTRVTS